MTNPVTITIDEIKFSTSDDKTILQAAEEIGIAIPTICYHDACTSNALCRICVVDVKGARTLIPACVAKVTEGMEVQTKNERVNLARKTILEMLASTSDLSQSPEILAIVE